jgi:hypothetical protein
LHLRGRVKLGNSNQNDPHIELLSPKVIALNKYFGKNVTAALGLFSIPLAAPPVDVLSTNSTKNHEAPAMPVQRIEEEMLEKVMEEMSIGSYSDDFNAESPRRNKSESVGNKDLLEVKGSTVSATTSGHSFHPVNSHEQSPSATLTSVTTNAGVGKMFSPLQLVNVKLKKGSKSHQIAPSNIESVSTTISAQQKAWEETCKLVNNFDLKLQNSSIVFLKEVGRGKYASVHAGRFDCKPHDLDPSFTRTNKFDDKKDSNIINYFGSFGQLSTVRMSIPIAIKVSEYMNAPPIVYGESLSDGSILSVPASAMPGARSIQEFNREVEALKALRHKNIVILLGVITSPRLGLVLEMVDGGSLAQVINNPDANQVYICQSMRMHYRRNLIHLNCIVISILK